MARCLSLIGTVNWTNSLDAELLVDVKANTRKVYIFPSVNTRAEKKEEKMFCTFCMDRMHYLLCSSS